MKLPPLVRVGMPKALSRSSRSTRAPASAAVRAALSPAGPPPATTTSCIPPSSPPTLHGGLPRLCPFHLVGDEPGDGEGAGRRGRRRVGDDHHRAATDEDEVVDQPAAGVHRPGPDARGSGAPVGGGDAPEEPAERPGDEAGAPAEDQARRTGPP